MGGYVGTKAVNLSTTAADVSGDANISGSITASGGTFSGDVDFGANKITYANVYAQLSDLPSASTYHGMFAHVHATGKAYFAHAGAWVPLTSGLGINDNADATAITIDSSENVMVGTTTQDAPVDNGGSGVTLRPQGVMLIGGTGTLIYANREDSDGEVMQFRKDGSPKGGIGISSDGPAFGTTSQQVAFHANKLFPCQSYGSALDNTIDLGYSGSRFKDLYLSGGINFSANANASGMTSELLNDYEVGTWTPAVYQAGWGITGATAHYTKIGNMVHITCDCALTGSGNGNDMRISGLPFSSIFNGYASGSGYTQYYPSAQNGSNANFTPYTGSNSTLVSFHNGNGAVYDGDRFSAGYLNFAVTYFTAS